MTANRSELEHEYRYWRDVYREHHGNVPVRDVFDQAGAAVHLLRPAPGRVEASLRPVELLTREDQARAWMAETLATCLGDRADAVAVQPDRVGDRLVLRTLGKDVGLFDGLLAVAGDDERAAAAEGLARAGSDWPAEAGRLAARAAGRTKDPPDDRERPSMAAHGLAVATRVGGLWVDVLTRLAEAGQLPLALDELDAAIPPGHAHLRRLALVLSQALLDRHTLGDDKESLNERARLLNNLSNFQAETGDRAAALATITEAVNLYRGLAARDPGAFLPDLAGSLNNQSNRQAATGDRPAALATITEAVNLYRGLAARDPGAFLPDLARSLRALARLDAAAADTSVTGSVDSLAPHPGHQAELGALRVTLRLQAGATADAGRSALAVAAAAPEGLDRPQRAALGRARRSLRATIAGTGTDEHPDWPPSALPSWATHPVDQATIDLANAWAAVAGTTGEHDFLRDNSGRLTDPATHDDLARLADLHPDHAAFRHAVAVLAQARESGYDQVVHDVAATNTAAHHVRAWIATPDWAESAAYLAAHHDHLAGDRPRRLLRDAADGGDLVAQHLAILDLAGTHGLHAAYDIVTDTAQAAQHAMSAVAAADATTLAAILAAHPALEQVPSTGAAALAGVALLAGAPDDARALCAIAAEAASPTQRRAHAARLRSLKGRRPDLAATVDELIAILDGTSGPAGGT